MRWQPEHQRRMFSQGSTSKYHALLAAQIALTSKYHVLQVHQKHLLVIRPTKTGKTQLGQHLMILCRALY